MNIFKFTPWWKKTADEKAIKRLTRTEKEAVLIDLKEGYGEIMGLVRDVRSHMVEQTIRTEKGLEILETLPDALASLPEQNRTQQRIAKALEEHCELVRQNDARFSDAFSQLSTSNMNQDQMIQAIQQQVTESRQSTEQIIGGLQAFRASMQDISEATQASNAKLQAAAQSNHRHLKMAIAACWLMAGVTLLTLGGGAYYILDDQNVITPGTPTNMPSHLVQTPVLETETTGSAPTARTERVSDELNAGFKPASRNTPVPLSGTPLKSTTDEENTIAPDNKESNAKLPAMEPDYDIPVPDSGKNIAPELEPAFEDLDEVKPLFKLPEALKVDLNNLSWPWEASEKTETEEE